MFKIGEFSKLTQVSVRMLRYYDETGLLKPDQTDKFTGYRLYSVRQISALNKIIFLRDLGFNVSEITTALNDFTNQNIIKMLDQKKQEITRKISIENDKIAKIELAKRDLTEEKIEIHYSIKLKAVPEYRVLSLRRRVSDYYAEGSLWEELSDYADKNKIAISKNAFTIYHDTDYRDKGVDIEICAATSADGIGQGDISFRTVEAVPYMAYRMVHGEFGNIAAAYQSFADWLSQHTAYRMDGKSRQIVHIGPWNEKDPRKYLTELQIPLEKI